MKILGIETSCDETAVAIVRDHPNPNDRVIAEALLSQIDDHIPYGGVVPEVAARAHLRHLDGLVARCLADAGLTVTDLDGIAATGGPGLIGGVIVGVMTAKAIAAVAEIPFIAVNHLEAHALTARLTDDVAFPYLLLLVSGGHCQFLIVEGVGHYRRLGTTIDDALGEAFDKTAKMLGLGYPGGPAVEAAAKAGRPGRFTLPRPLKGRPGCHFSFSGLKTAVRQTVEKLPPGALTAADVADLCHAFQAAAADVLGDRLAHAIAAFRDRHPGAGDLVVAGGVAANSFLRDALERQATRHGLRLIAPLPKLCTDNGVMVAWAGLERHRLGQSDSLAFTPRPRWPLDPDAPKVGLGGRKA